MPFDRIEFNGGLRTRGMKKRSIRGIDHYTIAKYQDLNGLLGDNWHYKGLNINGDFCYVLLDTVEYYLYKRRPMKEFIPLIVQCKKQCYAKLLRMSVKSDIPQR